MNERKKLVCRKALQYDIADLFMKICFRPSTISRCFMYEYLEVRVEKLEKALAEQQIELASLRADLQTVLAIANAANQAHGQIDELSHRVDLERVLGRKVFIQSDCGGFLSDRNNQGGLAVFQGNTDAWETMTIRLK